MVGPSGSVAQVNKYDHEIQEEGERSNQLGSSACRRGSSWRRAEVGSGRPAAWIGLDCESHGSIWLFPFLLRVGWWRIRYGGEEMGVELLTRIGFSGLVDSSARHPDIGLGSLLIPCPRGLRLDASLLYSPSSSQLDRLPLRLL